MNEKKTVNIPASLSLIVNTAHKAASTMTHSIFHWAAKQNNQKLQSDFYLWDLKEDTNIFFCRNSGGENLWVEKPVRHLIIARHPIGSAISKYYSFGWTHGVPNEDFVKNVREPIQKQSLEEFVKDDVQHTVKHLKSTLLPILNKEVSNKSFLFVPYELIISREVNYFDLVKLSMGSTFKTNKNAFEQRFKKDFEPVSDKSDLIVKGLCKDHRRTSDPFEFEKKISKDIINNIKESFPIIFRYEKLLKNKEIIKNL